MTKQKIIFIMPPKKWFYGIDYANSERIIKYFKNNNIFIVYKFEDIEIFFKEKLSFRDFLKLIYIYLFFKINKPQYVFAHNAAYIVNCNLIYKKKILNFFSQILKIKCILRWDHINEQVPNIVDISYGRGVGYTFTEHDLGKEIHNISATKIRAKMREEGKLK